MLSSCGERNRDFKTVDSVRKKKNGEGNKKMQKKKKKKGKEATRR